jgi:hypothetical protein
MNMKMLRLIGVVALLTACVFAYISHERGVGDELARLRRQTTELQTSLDQNAVRTGAGLAAVSKLSDLAVARAQAAAPAPAPDKAERPRPGRDESAPDHAPPPSPAEMTAHYQQAFSQESIDRDWSSSARTKFQTGASTLLPKASEIVSLECRTSICRVQVRHHSLEDYRAFTQDAYLKGNTHIWDGQMFTTIIGEAGTDSVMTVAFLARDGRSLPAMPN